MKIAYFITHDLTKEDGVTKKILNQVEIWKEMGNEVRIFCFSKNIGVNNNLIHFYKIKDGLEFKIKKDKIFFNDLKNYNPDIVYLRYTSIGINTYLLMKNYKVIVELNTYNFGEDYLLLKKEKNIKRLLRFLFSSISTHFTIKYSKGIVAVTFEILDKMNLNNKKSIVVPNSISLNKVNIIKEKGDKKQIELFFMGSPNQDWHGVDYIEKLALFLPKYNFHIIGMNGKNTNNLFWHGYLSEEEYLKIIQKCHFGIGTLALYRKDMLEACPLKVREYLAYGFPIIIGYKDTAFKLYKELPNWVLTINARNLELEINNIIKFIEKYRDIVLAKNEVLKYIDSNILEKRRIDFFEGI